jgi:hypothetical protein
MSDPQRLLHEEGATDFEREILASWHHAKPTAGARARTLAIVGIATGAAVMTAATSAAGGHGTAGAAAAGGSIAPKAAGMGALAILKWAAIGAVAIGATGAAIGYVRREPPRAVPPSAFVDSKPSAPEPLAVAQAPLDPPVVAAPLSSPARPPAARNAAPARATEARPAPSALAEQVAALDHARAALADGDPARARQLVEAYETRFPGGAFGQEAEVLRVEALLAQGDHAGAKRAGARFLTAYPASPHAARVRALLDAPSQ